MIGPVVESLSQRAIDQRALSLLHIDLLHLEEVIDVENHIFLQGLILADDEPEVQLPLFGVLSEENLEDERSPILLGLLYCVSLLGKPLDEGGEDDEVV